MDFYKTDDRIDTEAVVNGGIAGHFHVPYPSDSLRSQKIVPYNFFEPPYIFLGFECSLNLAYRYS